MLSDLRHALRRIVPPADAERIAIGLAAMIDGLWLRATLSSPQESDSRTAREIASAFVDGEIARAAQARPVERSAVQPYVRPDIVKNHIGGALCRCGEGGDLRHDQPGDRRDARRGRDRGHRGGRARRRGGAARPGGVGAMTGAERGRAMRRVADLLRARNADLARLETLDTGKPIQETSQVDVISGAECFEYFAGQAAALAGEHVDLGPSAFGYTRREPLGIVAGIGAWNYPLQIACWKAAPALACGNAMIFKPAELTPLTAAKLAEIVTRGRAARRRLQRRPGLRRDRAAPHPPSGHRQGVADRRGRHRQGGDGGRGADAQARDARARRQVAADRLRRRRPRRCGVRRAARQLLLRRRGLLERHPRLRARPRPRRLPRKARCAGRAHGDRRSARSEDAGRRADLAGAHEEGARLHPEGAEGRGEAARRRPAGEGGRARQGLLRPADHLRRLQRRHGDRARGDLRAGDDGALLRRRRTR